MNGNEMSFMQLPPVAVYRNEFANGNFHKDEETRILV
jgi:hypothetical protein